VTLLRQGGCTRWPTEVPSNPYYSVTLWFCDRAERVPQEGISAPAPGRGVETPRSRWQRSRASLGPAMSQRDRDGGGMRLPIWWAMAWAAADVGKPIASNAATWWSLSPQRRFQVSEAFTIRRCPWLVVSAPGQLQKGVALPEPPWGWPGSLSAGWCRKNMQGVSNPALLMRAWVGVTVTVVPFSELSVQI